MATKIIHKKSSVASSAPVAADIAPGELALNLADQKIYSKQTDGTIIEMAPNIDQLALTETCKNVSGGSLAIGTPVYQSGTAGNAMEVQAARADTAGSMPAIGVITSTLADEAEGTLVLTGFVQGLNTSSFSEGDTLYIGATGGLVNTAPAGESNLIQNVGKVIKVHASNGSIMVTGAGRANATPNLDDGDIFIGNSSGQATTSSLSTEVQTIGDARYVEVAGDTMTGDLSFGDNDKAIFGADSDLQIYHDGEDSFISDQGTGDLIIRGTTKVKLQSAAGNTYFEGTNGSEARVYFNGSTKLKTTNTGIEVNGNVVLSGTVDGRDVATDGTKLDTIATNADVTPSWVPASDPSYLTSVTAHNQAWTTITGTPTTLAGYGITDGADATKLPLAGGALTGAVTTNSTFDGRNVGDDGDKLDTIELNAKDDQDKADIDALNIDADTLDGQHGSYYTGYTDTAIGNLINSAPAALDTLNELAASLGDDDDFAGSMTTALAGKASTSHTHTFASLTSTPTTIAGYGITDTFFDGAYSSLTGTPTIPTNNNELTNGAGYVTTDTVYTHPTHDGDDIDIDTTALTGATVISDLDLNVTTDTLGHVTDANATIATRTLTLGDLGFTGASNANYITNTNELTNGAGFITTFTDTNTTYTGGDGISLSGTTFNIDDDLRGHVSQIGLDTNDFITVSPTVIDFSLDGNVDMRLENDGDLHVDGNVVAYSTTTSDERLKKDIVKIDNALDKVSQLNGYTFEYLNDGKKSAGILAQEVEAVMPSAVSEMKLPLKSDDDQEYKVVQYDQLHGLLIEAIKELKAEIETLKGK